MKQEKVAIIIVNWNGKKFLKNCLNSIFKQTYKNFDVYFVDNGSIDESSKYVKENFLKVKIIQLDKNYGFAKGNNEGIKEAFKDKKVEYIVCLNNDTIVDKNWLKELVKTAEKDKKIGIVQSKVMLNYNFIQSAGVMASDDLLFVHRGFGGKKKDYSKVTEIFIAYGASFLIKKETLNKIGLFDEMYFAYQEEVDLAIRARMQGYKIFYSAKSIVLHLHSQTLSALSYTKAFYNTRNMIYNLIKHYPLKLIFLKILNSIKRSRIYSENVKKMDLYFKLRLYTFVTLDILINLPMLLKKRLMLSSTNLLDGNEFIKMNNKFKLNKEKYLRSYLRYYSK